MKRIAQLVVVATALLAVSADVAAAQRRRRVAAPSPAPVSASVPELDPSAAGAAFTVLIGGALLLRGRRRSAAG